MNPLDNQELTLFLRNLKEEMPIHTDNMMKIKMNYGIPPKNLNDYSVIIDDKFLNSNLAVIEEINHRDSKHWIPKWFQQYQNRIYGDSDILNKDNFFKATLHDTWRECYEKGIPFPKVSGGGNHGNKFISFGRILGAELLTSASSSTNDAIGLTQLLAYKMATNGTVGEWYNQVAIKRGTSGSGGNFIGAIYSDSGSTAPDILLDYTASTAYGATSSYTYTDLANGGGQLVTAITWVAFQNDATTPVSRDLSSTATNLVANLANVYGTPPSTWTGSYTESANPFHYKCRGN